MPCEDILLGGDVSKRAPPCNTKGMEMMRKKRRKKPVPHVRRKHAMPFNFASGLIYSITAIAAVTLGAFFYRSVRNAPEPALGSPSPGEESPVVPPGSKVITRDGQVSQMPAAPREPYQPPAEEPRTPAAVPIAQPAVTAAQPAVEASAPPAEPQSMPDLVLPAPPAWKPTAVSDVIPGKVSLKALADTAIVLGRAGGADEKNGGAATELPLRGNEQFFIAQYDLERVRGWSITKAHWFGKVNSGRVRTLGFSTIPAPWQEGTGTPDAPAEGGATLHWADHGKTQWCGDGAPLAYLIRGGGGSFFSTGDPAEGQGDPDTWVQIEMDPAIVQALIAGTAHGIAVTDEKGQLGTATTIASKENSRFAQYIEVVGTRSDITQPGTLANLAAWAHPDLRRESSVGVVLTWTATGDDGDQGQAFSYEIRYAPAPAVMDRTRLLPPELTPRPQHSGSPDKAIIEGLEPDTLYTFFVRAVDEVGQPGTFASVDIKTPQPIQMPATERPTAYPDEAIDILAGALTLRVAEETELVDPVTGEGRAGGGRKTRRTDAGSFLWDRSSRTLRLRAARNETIGALLVLGIKQGALPPIEFSTLPLERAKRPLGGDGFRFHRVWYSAAPASGARRVWNGDALIPIKGRMNIENMPNKIAGQTHQAVHAELHVPAAAEPGTYLGGMRIANEAGVETALNVILDVLPATMPPEPTFIVELLAPPTLAMLYKKDVSNTDDAGPVEVAYHRIAREHRCTLAILSYLPNGSSSSPFIPPINGAGLDLDIPSWSAWDGRFQRLLDGTAFMGSSMGSAPVSHMILPVFDNWPTSFETSLLRAEDAFPLENEKYHVYGGRSDEIEACLAPDYWRGIRAAVRQFRDHFRTRGWRETTAHFWLNNNPSANYTGKPPLWYLGTPVYRDDFLALENYARFARADIATWPAGGLAIRVAVTNAAALAAYGTGLFSLLTTSDTEPHAWRQLRRRAETTGETLWFESPVVPMAQEPASIEASALGYFLEGADGWSIRETVGRPENWPRAAPQSLLYCGAPLQTDAPAASLRLKVLRRTVQDIEYLVLLQKKMGWNRRQLADFVCRQVPTLATQPNDVGSHDLHTLRMAAQALLSTP